MFPNFYQTMQCQTPDDALGLEQVIPGEYYITGECTSGSIADSFSFLGCI
jgi:hypothetical protein